MTVAVIVKVTLLFALALAATMTAKRLAAETRHKLLAGAQLAALLIPLLAAIVPPLPVAWMPAPAQLGTRIAQAPAPVIETGAPAATAASTPRRATNVLTLIWLIGFASVAAAKLVALFRAAAIVRRARPFGGVLLSDEVDQPSTFGRSILLPGAAATWSDERLRAVLLHEQAHVARHDTLHGMISDAACAVYWFHPFAWLVARAARLERERACDDVVLSRGVAPGDYATAMLDVARVLSRRSAAIPMADQSHLEQRIRAILDPATRRRAPRAIGIAVVMTTIAAAPLLAAITSAIVPRPRSIEPDRLGDPVASPFSERIEPAAPARVVDARGRDAALIATMSEAASKRPRTAIDFVPERARWALTRVRDGELVAPLIESLEDHDWRVRAYAACALGHSGDRRATEPLLPLLDEPVWRVRAMAAHALANLGDPSAEEAMLRVIDDPAWQVRTEVVRYLAATGGRRATIEAMKQDRHIAVRAAAERGLE